MLELLYNKLVKYLFLLHLYEVKHLSVYLQNPRPDSLIIVYGTSSSGKTSLIKDFMTLRKNTITISFDEVFDELNLEYLYSHVNEKDALFLKEYNHDLIYFLFCDKSDPFLEKAFGNNQKILESLERLQNLAKTAFHELIEKTIPCMAEKAKRLLYYDKTVILDIVSLQKKQISLFDIEPIMVLNFCNFEQLANNIRKRNLHALAHAQPTEWRDPMLALSQYFSVFLCTSKIKYKLLALEKINTYLIEVIFKNAYMYDKKKIPFPPPDVKKFTERDYILKQAKFNVDGNAFSHCRYSPSLILHAKDGIAKSAGRLSDFLTERETIRNRRSKGCVL